jgi:hypothetical protein
MFWQYAINNLLAKRIDNLPESWGSRRVRDERLSQVQVFIGKIFLCVAPCLVYTNN